MAVTHSTRRRREPQSPRARNRASPVGKEPSGVPGPPREKLQASEPRSVSPAGQLGNEAPARPPAALALRCSSGRPLAEGAAEASLGGPLEAHRPRAHSPHLL